MLLIQKKIKIKRTNPLMEECVSSAEILNKIRATDKKIKKMELHLN